MWWQSRWSCKLNDALRHVNRAGVLCSKNPGEKIDIGNTKKHLNTRNLYIGLRLLAGDYLDYCRSQSELAASEKDALAGGLEHADFEMIAQLLLHAVSENGQSKLCNIAFSAGMELIDLLLNSPSTRLASYGTLRRGESNHNIVAHIKGDWLLGIIEGEVVELEGYPAFTWQAGGSQVNVEVLCAETLPLEFAQIDDFEGVNYRRILVPVKTANGFSVCNTYQNSYAEI